MKLLIITLLFGFSTNSFAGDFSELDSVLSRRVSRGCLKYARKQAQKHLSEHFNMNYWAGGNVGSGSVLSAEEELPSHISFLTSQCQNMVSEVLELKLGYAPWQNN